MTGSTKPRLVGFNHVAIEVGDIDEALDFYGKLFTFELRSKEPGSKRRPELACTHSAGRSG